jgi:enoyl-CoA hydratase
MTASAPIVIAGSEKAFAAGADIAEMKDYSYMDAYMGDYITGGSISAPCASP